MSISRVAHDDDSEFLDSPAGFAELLSDADDGEGLAPDSKADPGAAFRFVYDAFVKRGAYARGKPRHSVRQIKQWLGDNQVRSLETKLAGKTRLSFEDAKRLLQLILDRWHYNEAKGLYNPYDDGDLDGLATTLLKDLFPKGAKAILLPDRSRDAKLPAGPEGVVQASSQLALEKTEPSNDVIRDCFAAGDALITVSRARTIIGTDPAEAMTDFNLLMADLHAMDRKDERKRALIWVIDLGLRNEKPSARGTIYNLQLLATQFRTIALTRSPDRADSDKENTREPASDQSSLYDWLRKNTCFIVGSLSNSEIDALYDGAGIALSTDLQDRPWWQADRLFLESVPGRWLDPEGSEAFGPSQKELWQEPTITAHLRLEDWRDLKHTGDLDRSRNLRYYFHGAVDGLEEDEDPVRCIPLPEPGSRWSDAYRLACNAAFFRLGYASEKRLQYVGTPEESLALLKAQYFAALTLDEFLGLLGFLSDLREPKVKH